MAFSRTPKLAADGTFSTVGVDAWNNQIFGVSGATVGGIAYFPTASSEAMSGMTWNVSGAAGEGLAITAGVAGSAVMAMSLSQTRNFNGSATNWVQWTFTDTSHNAGDSVFRILGGAAGTTDLLRLVTDGGFTTGGTITSGPNSTITSQQHLVCAANGIMNFSGRGYWAAASDGNVAWRNNNGDASSGVVTTGKLNLDFSGVAITLTNATTTTGGNVGTLTNCPHTGNPALYAEVSVNGTTYCVPCFALT